MPTTYSAADTEVNELLAQVMKRWHKPLHEAGVRVGVLMASELKANGYPAYATIKVVALKDRLAKQYDAELVIDFPEWEVMRERHRKALLDHELSHIQLAKARTTGDACLGQTESGIVFERDDLGRPKLRTVKGDWSGSDGFREVVARHRNFAVEFLNARRVHTFAVAARDGIDPKTQQMIDGLDEPIDTAESTTEPEGEMN